MSFGVSASTRGEAFDYKSVCAEADEALYRAKGSGRDRVCAARAARAQEPTPLATAAGPIPVISG
jgi:hypothetical protein